MPNSEQDAEDYLNQRVEDERVKLEAIIARQIAAGTPRELAEARAFDIYAYEADIANDAAAYKEAAGNN